MNYEQSVKLLQSQGKFYINLGLERIQKILKYLGNPQDRLKIIHVAGTNGKGSVCSVLANILTVSGYKTGLYTSPHLVEYTERIKINNQNISYEDFSKYISLVCSSADEINVDLTEFEILTAAAFLYFAEKNADIAIVETGLGGRYDATNIITNPLLTIITSISKDHTDRLGHTIEKISYEKAGIIKNNCDVIVAASNKGYKIIKSVAAEKQAKLHSVTEDIKTIYENGINYAFINGEKFEFSLLGLYQEQNLALITECIKVLEQAGFKLNLEKGLSSAVWGARLEFIKEKNTLIDGAHNPDSAFELKKSLDFYFKNQKKIFIYSTINTKDYLSVAKILFDEDDQIYYLEFNHPNAVTYKEYIAKVDFLKNIKPINKKQLENILNLPELKVITGSLYMIGEIYLQIKKGE